MAGWDLGGDSAESFYNAWKTNVKLAWRVPRSTKTFLLQQVLAPGFVSAKVEILARYTNFFHSLRTAPSHEVRTAALLGSRDLRSVTGRNLSLIADLTGLDPWCSSTARVRAVLLEREKVEPDPADVWRCESWTNCFSSIRSCTTGEK